MPLGTPAGRQLYRVRGAAERFFAWLKTRSVLEAPIPSTGHLERVLTWLWFGQLVGRIEAAGHGVLPPFV